MLSSALPWAMVTPESSLFSSSSFLERNSQRHLKKVSWRDTPEDIRSDLPDIELEVPGDDARLLVVPDSVPGELEDLRGEVLHHCGHVDGSSAAHPRSSLPAKTTSVLILTIIYGGSRFPGRP